jgi:acyl-CoA hydrolase
MNRKPILAAAILAAASASSFAIEGEQFVVESSVLSRDIIRNELRELQSIGAWESMQEASPTPLQALETDRKIAQAYADAQPAQVAIIIEAVPLDESQIAPDMKQLFGHPAVATDGE